MKDKRVFGVDAPPPRPTFWAGLFFCFYVGLPLVLVLAALDLALWFSFDWLFGWCYGVACLFD